MNRKLRIAVITSSFPIQSEPYRGIPIYQTVLALQHWADVEVFCMLSRYPQWSALQPRRFRYRRQEPGYSPPGVRTHYIEYPAVPFLSRPFSGAVCARRLLPYLQKTEADMVLAYWLYPEGYGAVSVARKLGLPVVVGSRGSDLARMEDPFTLRGTRSTVRRATFVLTVSEELRQRAIKLGVPPERVKTISNGSDRSVFHSRDRGPARTELGVPLDCRLILFVGRLEPRKGVWELLEALGRLAPSHPSLELACIGETPQEGNPFRAQASKADLKGRVRFLGPQTTEQVAHWLAAADLLCLPSYSEGCPNVVVEALSCGRPVVATDVGGIPEMVDATCGLLIPPRDPARLAEALAGALQRPWDPATISARFGRSWDQVAEETYQVCRSVWEAGRSR